MSKRKPEGRARRATRSSAIAAALFAVLLTGCAQPHLAKYDRAVATNYRNFDSIRLGMTMDEVQQRMGRGHLVNYKRVQLRNPWQTEAFRVSEALRVDVLFYVTQGYVWQSPDGRHATTPVVFENGRVAGWGWGYLDRNRERFTVK